MKIAQSYSHLNGEEYLIVHHKELYDELRSIIGASKDVKIEGVYPGYEETFEYPLDLSNSK